MARIISSTVSLGSRLRSCDLITNCVFQSLCVRCFRNNPPSSSLDGILRGAKWIKAATWQLEKGESGTPHWQIYLQTSRVEFNTVKKLFTSCHIEKANGSAEENLNYTGKEDSRLEGPWSYGTLDMSVGVRGSRNDIKSFRQAVDNLPKDKYYDDLHEVEEIAPVMAKYDRYAREYYRYKRSKQEPRDMELYPWQRDLMEYLVGDWETRNIYWVWSHESETGKSTMMQYVAERLRTLIANSSNINDIMHAYDEHKVIWIDIPRQQPLDAKMTSLLETLSNGGLLPSNKYNSCMKRVQAHIVVSCNRSPPEDKLPKRLIEIQASSTIAREVIDLSQDPNPQDTESEFRPYSPPAIHQ